MGEMQNRPFQLSFNVSLKIDLEVLLPEIGRQPKLGKEVVFRAAAFARPEVWCMALPHRIDN